MSKPIGRIEFKFVQVLLFIQLFLFALRKYKNLKIAVKSIKNLAQHGEKLLGGKKMQKTFKVDGKYTWSMFNPHWPSPSFSKYFHTELESMIPTTNGSHVRRLFLAFTKKCPLACDHCSEWDSLNNEDKLTLIELQSIVDTWVDQGVGQIVFTGGEPLSRFEDLKSLLARYKNQADLWIYSSGFGLTLKKAKELKKAGVNGIAISLDHHNPQSHNDFRGSEKSYDMAINAIKYCHEVGIIVALNICPSRDYVNSHQLKEYMHLAKTLQVAFVHVLEPRAVGHFSGLDVEFTEKERANVEEIFFEYNFDKSKNDYPIVIFQPVGRKVVPCGGGKSYIFIDYDGSVHNCPLCKIKMVANVEAKCTVDGIAEQAYATH